VNKGFPCKLPLLTAACLAATLLGSNVQAAVVGANLQQAMQSGDEVRFIVRFTDKLDHRAFRGKGKGKGRKGMKHAEMLRALKNKADFSQSAAMKVLKGKGSKGGRRAKRVIQLWSINALAVTASPETVQALATLPGVSSITLDHTLNAPSPEPAAAAAPEWNLDVIRAPELWSAGYDGTGTVVANMDTGVDVNHPDLAASWRGGANSWFDPNGEHFTPYDKTGHGTQTMSLMAGGDAGGSSIGVSPGAQWIAVKIFNDAGLAPLSSIHQGFQWLLDPDGDPATNDMPDVVNNSWGYSSLVGLCYTEFAEDITMLKDSGIAVVFSGGNQGTLGSVSPADNPEGFAVGAVNASLNIASTSSRGPSACDGSFFPEVVAPGVNVRAADLTFGGVFPDSYASVSGTSFSAPHVAGTMALLRQANPNTTVAELEQALTDSAIDLGAAGADDKYGYGLIDTVAANDLLAINTTPSCTDFDGDGFFAEVGCGTEVDCLDFDDQINPAACDILNDGIDQDCDGVDRLQGIACPVPGVAPLAFNDIFDAEKSISLNVVAPGVLSNDTDQDGDTLTAVLNTPPAAGSLVFNADGSFNYTPDPAAVDGDIVNFTYFANDGTQNSTLPATVTINVTISVAATDSDGDGVNDSVDNCTLIVNPLQRDTDGDGFGNFCDPDFNSDLIVNATDLSYLKSRFFSSDPDADLNGDGVVNAADIAILKSFFFQPPGP
jgi:bacillopeptidase F